MASSEFFEPAYINKDVYVGGDNVAKSPALFSYLHTMERNNTSDIRVISIGSIIEEPTESLILKYSLLDWYRYLLRDNQDIVQHTMDYMLTQIIEKKGHSFHKFQLNKDSKWWEDYIYKSNRTGSALR